MRIAIIATGSQGDVQPYVALGKGLKEAGHEVRLLIPENFANLGQAYGLTVVPMQGNIQEIVESPELRQLLEKGNFLAINAYTSRAVQQVAIQWTQTGLEACQGMDLLLAGVGGLYISLALAEKLHIPLVQAHVFPFTPTQAFPGVLFPKFIGQFGGVVNWLSHHVLRQIMWQGFRAGDQSIRQQVLHIPRAPFWGPVQTDDRFPTLYGFSPSVIPHPPDWKNTLITGYWFLDTAPDWTPPASLKEFLEHGPPPIYIGFGSMGSRDPEATAELVLQALAQTQQRAILLSGWSGIQKDNLPSHVYLGSSIPHTWLFPRVAAVIHHGGAGTTAAGLRAGVPTVIIPFFGDQGFWGQRVADLGVGPKPIPRKQLTIDNLARSIQTVVTDPAMRRRAASLGRTIQSEDGVAQAVARIQQLEL